MKVIKTIEKKLNSPLGAYIFNFLAVTAFAFLKSAQWTYSWIADLYPLGENFVPLLFGIIAASGAAGVLHLLLQAMGKGKSTAVRVIHLIFEVISVVVFVFTLILLFGLDSGISAQNFFRGMQLLLPRLPLKLRKPLHSCCGLCNGFFLLLFEGSCVAQGQIFIKKWQFPLQ